MKKQKDNALKKDREEPEALFIPTGVLLGMGFGFLYDKFIAGLFLGLGVGFLIFAIISLWRHRK